MAKDEFTYCWNNWIKKVRKIRERKARDINISVLKFCWPLFCFYPQIVRPVSAIIVVDVQNDFISGSLAISNCPAGQNGEEVGMEQTT